MEDTSSLAEAILEQIADAVIFADATGTIRRWNHAAVALFGLGHMTVDTCGKRYLPTLHMAFKAHRMSAEVPRSSKESCCPNMAIRLGEFLDGRR